MKYLRIPLIATLLLIGIQVVGQTAAHAGLPDCSSLSTAAKTAGIQCTAGNGSGNGGDNIDHSWVPLTDTGPPCMHQSPQYPSYISTLRNVNTGETIPNYCVAQSGAGKTDLKGKVKQKLKAPVPDPDFKSDFLTGAPIHFSTPALKDYSLDVPNFPGVKLIITTTDVTWNFGDGTTSKDLEPTHVYESISPDQNKKDQHTVHVSVTATWQATMMDPTSGQTEDLGTFTDTGAIDRSIVQVWSKQTEPNS